MDLTTKDLVASLHHRAQSYKLSANPLSTEIKKLRRSTTKNCKEFSCLIAGTAVDNYNWAFILESAGSWRRRHLLNQGIDLANNVAVIAATCPPYPTCDNPGELIIGAGWNSFDLQVATHRHKIRVRNFQFKTRLIQALLQEYLEAIPNSIIAAFKNKDGDFKSGTTITQILEYLEVRYDKLTAAEITKIMKVFAEPMRTDLTAPEYYQVLENCRTELIDTNEEISDHTMIRTALEQFEKLHWMSTNATDWKTKVRDHPTTSPDLTWDEFKNWWDEKFLAYADEQQSLQSGGIAASGVGVTEEALKEFGKDVEDSNKELVTSLQTALESRDAQLVRLEAQVTALQASTGSVSMASQPPVPFVNSPAASGDAARFAALEARLETLTTQQQAPAVARRSRERRPKWDRSVRRYNNTNYCWTHGCDIDPNHTSSSCMHKKAGHVDGATINDRKGGCNWFLALVGNPASSS